MNARLISTNAQVAPDPLAKWQAASQSKPGTRIKVRAGFYLYTPENDTNSERGAYEIIEEEELTSDGGTRFTGLWKTGREGERGEWFSKITLRLAIETIEAAYS